MRFAHQLSKHLGAFIFIFALHVHLPKRPEVNNRSHLFFDILRACLTTREDRLNKSDPVVFIASSSTQQQDKKKTKQKQKKVSRSRVSFHSFLLLSANSHT